MYHYLRLRLSRVGWVGVGGNKLKCIYLKTWVINQRLISAKTTKVDCFFSLFFQDRAGVRMGVGVRG